MADYQYVVETGVIVPDTGVILTDVQDEYRNAFGQDLSVDPSTPQGVLINAEAITRSEVVQNNAALANQINPNIAGGIFLDAILALTGAERVPAVHTTVTCQLTGTPFTVIPEGSQASDTTYQEVFQSLDEVMLDTEGNAQVVFRAINPGPLDIDASTLTQIITSILGWETISNSSAGTPGTNEQSDASARNFRKATLASQGSSLAEAIISAIYEVEGVKSLSFRENILDHTVTIDGISMVAHSIYACVDGGDSTEVATAILSKKSGGCNYNGGTIIDVTEPFSGQVYAVKFDRPSEIPVLIKATVKVDNSIQDPQVAVKQALLAYANGDIPGEAGFVVGGSVSCFELAGAVTCLFPGIYVKNMETTINIMSPDYSNDEIPIAIDEKATTEESSITVEVVP